MCHTAPRRSQIAGLAYGLCLVFCVCECVGVLCDCSQAELLCLPLNVCQCKAIMCDSRETELIIGVAKQLECSTAADARGHYADALSLMLHMFKS